MDHFGVLQNFASSVDIVSSYLPYGQRSAHSSYKQSWVRGKTYGRPQNWNLLSSQFPGHNRYHSSISNSRPQHCFSRLNASHSLTSGLRQKMVKSISWRNPSVLERSLPRQKTEKERKFSVYGDCQHKTEHWNERVRKITEEPLPFLEFEDKSRIFWYCQIPSQICRLLPQS